MKGRGKKGEKKTKTPVTERLGFRCLQPILLRNLEMKSFKYQI